MAFLNETRGLRITGTGFTYLTQGAYAAVFADYDQMRVRKIFFRTDDETHCRDTFKAQVDAYIIASSATNLAQLVPQFYGIRSEQVIQDREGRDVTCEFYPDLSYEIELIDCHFVDIGTAGREEETRIYSLFHQYGINYLRDSSVCLNHGKIPKVIDFATTDIEPEWRDEY